MEILKTKNWEMFKSITMNREVDASHVKKLVKSISNKNLLHLNPIMVDENLNVIDGQHRLEACRLLDIDVHYVISNKISQDDLRVLNGVQKSWTQMDYINYYTLKGVKEFVDLSKLINAHPNMYVSALVQLCTKWSRDNDLKNGVLKIDNITNAHKICGLIERLAAMGYESFAYGSVLAMAIKKCDEDEDFDWDVFFKKVENNPRAFVKCSSKNEYLKMIEELYNRYQSKNLVNLTHKKAA